MKKRRKNIMRNFNQLKSLSEMYTNSITELPNNPFIIASQLHIDFKSSSQCENDTNLMNIFISHPAFMRKIKNKNVIYFDENSKYWQFYFFHELSHYILQHKYNSIENEQEANILSCLLIAPERLLPSYLKSATDLSLFANIPISKAEEYWQELKIKRRKNIFSFKKDKILTSVTIISVCLLIAALTKISFAKNEISSSILQSSTLNDVLSTNSQTTTPVSTDIDGDSPGIQEFVYITSSGNKYHKADCAHLKGKTNVNEINISEALSHGYMPCKSCFD